MQRRGQGRALAGLGRRRLEVDGHLVEQPIHHAIAELRPRRTADEPLEAEAHREAAVQVLLPLLLEARLRRPAERDRTARRRRPADLAEERHRRVLRRVRVGVLDRRVGVDQLWLSDSVIAANGPTPLAVGCGRRVGAVDAVRLEREPEVAARDPATVEPGVERAAVRRQGPVLAHGPQASAAVEVLGERVVVRNREAARREARVVAGEYDDAPVPVQVLNGRERPRERVNVVGQPKRVEQRRVRAAVVRPAAARQAVVVDQQDVPVHRRQHAQPDGDVQPHAGRRLTRTTEPS